MTVGYNYGVFRESDGLVADPVAKFQHRQYAVMFAVELQKHLGGEEVTVYDGDKGNIIYQGKVATC